MSETESEIGAFMAGFVIGGLVGAATALILAPQSGEETRAQIAAKSHELQEAGAQQYETARVRVHDTTVHAQEQARIVLDEGKNRMQTNQKSTEDETQVENTSEEPDANEDATA